MGKNMIDHHEGVLDAGSWFDKYRSVFHADSISGVGFPIILTGNKMAATEIRTMAN